MVHNHWKVVVLATVVVVGATWWTGRSTIQRYQSYAQVQVNSKKQVFARLDDIDVEELALRTDPVLSEALVLSTQALALVVVQREGLQLQLMDPEVRRADVLYDVQVDTLARPDSFTLRILGPRGYELRDSRGQVIASGPYERPAVAPGFSFMVHHYDGEPYDVRFAIVPAIAAANLVRGGIGYQVQPNTNVVSVTYTGTDPSLTPNILNAAVDALAQYGVDRIRDMAARRLQYINERVEDARSRYLAALARVQSYKESQHTTDLSADEVALIQTIQELDRERERRNLDLATIQGIMAGGDTVTLETVNRLAAVAAISTNPAMAFQLENILRLYDERRTLVAGTGGLREQNPQIQAIDQRIAQASRALVDATAATVRGLESSIRSLEEQIRRQRAQLATFPGKQTEFAQLSLDADLQNDTYRYLLSQLEAARISAATIAPYIQIVETATVAVPIGMGNRQKLMIGLLVGIFLGVIAAFFLEYLDQTIKNAADVERALEVPVLGLIPFEPAAAGAQGNGRRKASLPLVSLVSPDHPSSEAYRTLRTNVTFVNAEERALQVLVVTSPGPGEGKSTTAANLAITLAQQGTRVLLVDADLRRPLVHRAFSLVQEPGLTDVLVGTAHPREAIRPNVVPKLDVLPAGALPPNPSELLGSPTMHRLLAQLRTEYQTIVFDSPPALAVTDAAVLGAAADAVILVLRAGETEEVAAQRALEQLRRVQARVAGTVLNGVEKDSDRYYNYYTYYRADRGTGGLLTQIKQRIVNML
ncbi:MAG TPA: polysaccharide biosynthesis tyrosine autokinase [Gemmatimonadales bacterium]|nr:polysaccharide biosynthesis tyrosine autokinase [Gemmatimonadales bacterium]